MNDKKEALKQKLTTARADLLDLLAHLTEAEWQTAVFADETNPDGQWTALDIVRHLMNAERGMTGLMMNIQSGKGGVPENFDLARYNQQGINKNADKSPAELTADLQQNRANLLTFIDVLAADDWQKEGRHANLNIYTIEEICHIIADHEQSHVHDIRQAVTQ